MRILSIVLFLLVHTGLAQELPSYRTNNIAAMRQRFEEEQAQYAGNTNVLVLPGVLADREARRVIIQAEATGITGRDTAEFFIIAPHSGNDYEALTSSLATAADIDRGLRFIGLTPGRCVDYARYQFWPKGERVMARVRRAEDGSPALPLEVLVLSETTGKPLPAVGLVYVQAPTEWVAASEFPDRHPVDADSRGSIAANYNEPFTLFDIPRAAPQSDVYAQQTVNPDYIFQPGQRLEIVMEPERPEGEQRIQDLELTLHATGVATQSLADLQFALTNLTTGASLPMADMNEILHYFTVLCRGDTDPFVALRIDDHVQVDALKAFCLILASIETDHGIRLEPPGDAHLYYKAFMPDDSLRDREQRIMQPAELTFSASDDGSVTVSLLEITEHWHDEAIKPALTFKTHPIVSPETLREQLTALEEDLPILLAFVPPTLTHGELMRWMTPILATHPTVHVFTPATQP